MRARELCARAPSFAAIGTAFVALLVPALGYVPIWDGHVYATCAVQAAGAGLSFESLRCAGHPSQGYALLLALGQLLRPGDVLMLHLTNVLLGLIALGCIRAVLACVFPAEAFARELDLVTLACAVHPVLLSTLVQVNLDFGVYVFFFASLAALLRRRFGIMAVAGLFLCFSKETGVLAYALILALYAVFILAGDAPSIAARLRRLVPMWITMGPLLAFAAHVLWWNATHRQPAVWKHGWQEGPLDGFKFFDLSEPIFQSYVASLFVLGFMWVLTLVIGTDALVGVARAARRRSSREVPGADRQALAFVTVLSVVLIYLLTSYRTWTNVRYFALLYPLLVLLAFAALVRLHAARPVRLAAFAGIAVLFAWATWRSVDPLSRAVYGSFSIGDREMYRMASITGEYRGPGRDQLVYNLEFTGYHSVQNALFMQLHPTDSTSIGTARSSRWNIFSPLEAASFRRTMRQSGAVLPRYWDEESLLAAEPSARPHDVWFLAFSYREDADSSLRTLGRLYHELPVMRASASGHTIVAHHLELRAP